LRARSPGQKGPACGPLLRRIGLVARGELGARLHWRSALRVSESNRGHIRPCGEACHRARPKSRRQGTHALARNIEWSFTRKRSRSGPSIVCN
jgi:hypothetical protein